MCLWQLNLVGIFREKSFNPQVVVLVVTTIVLIIQMSAELVKIDRLIFAIALSALTMISTCLVKMLFVIINRKRFFDFLQHYHELQVVLLKNGVGDAKNVLEKNHFIGNRISKLNLLICWIAGTILMLIGYYSFGILYFTWCPCDDTQGIGYWANLIFQISMTFEMLIIYCPYVNLSILFFLMAASLFDVSANVFRDTFLTIDASSVAQIVEGSVDDKRINEEFRLFVDYHHNSIAFVGKITNLLAIGTGSDAMTCIVQAVAIALSTFMEGAGKVQYLFNFDLAVCIFQRFIFDFLSERINESNSRLCDLMYSVPWYRFSPKLRRKLLLMLRQCQKEQYVLTANYFPFSLRNFSFIFNKIYSFYTVLRDML
ncbi:odorant receptor Or2-like [Culicoides brevitarsis]|uniref:odorant receptor Or2-like n=1 Tax=Culicoides brevitarsis TaxID=469753 RepID=UPI00307C9B27